MHGEGDTNEIENDCFCSSDCAQVRPVQGVLDSYEPFDGERGYQPDAKKAADGGNVDDALAVALDVEDWYFESSIQPYEKECGEETEVSAGKGCQVIAGTSHF